MNKCRFNAPRQDMAGNGRMSLDPGGIQNKCVIFPTNPSMVADALEIRDHTWIFRTKVASDLIIEVGDSSFQLHKLPMVSRSMYLNRLVFQRRPKEDRDTIPKLRLENFPGGAETFALVVKFCYGWNVDLTATNIAPLYCAAHLLEMSEDFGQGNFVSKTEAFLSFVLFASWKDIFLIFKSCQTISSWAKELHIVRRCAEAISWKACIDPKTITSNNEDLLPLYGIENNASNTKKKAMAENWWFEDVAFLQIDHFSDVIDSIKRRGMKSELVGSCIAHWTAKWISEIPFRIGNKPKFLAESLLRQTAESLIKILPEEESSVSCNFLLHLFKLGQILRVNCELLSELERRIALLLEKCSVSDILVRNYSSSESIYDIGIITKIVENYSSALKYPEPRIFVVGRLVDEYLALVGRDEKLEVKQFQSLAQALPKGARNCDDSLYRAIDIYLKVHPSLTEEERTSISKAMDYHKLSQEACQHAMRNDRLPVVLTTQFVLLEQVNMTRSMIATGSNYRRTKNQAIIRVSSPLKKRSVTNQKEISMIKREVENIKLQLNDLQMCKIQLQRQANMCRSIEEKCSFLYKCRRLESFI